MIQNTIPCQSILSIEQIEKVSTPAKIFYLKTRGRKRGYNDTLDVTSNDESINMPLINFVETESE